ncbi:MAG: hypothetical protein HFP81_00440 [Methylococcales symbiont of Hymedesmia sp. n. MRB-2018]|nr:MAG: hypothetical protein HFP78_02950 [Methylococcales symbiont of Hymedesmia sp. n. MRB-2018]KAF3984772.1 MAG: hypothetical protein HFP81_00440 [Methylococcales symbiont of Hymedesmia sp. n. MRB-2018]
MKYYLLTFIPLLLTLPIFGEELLFGMPIWAIITLVFAVIYASSLVWLINHKWDELS